MMKALRKAKVTVKRDKWNSGAGDPVYYAYKDDDTFAGPDVHKDDVVKAAYDRLQKAGG